MKILFITHNFHPLIGGIEVNSEILATAFTNAGHEVRVVTWTLDAENLPFQFEVIRDPKVFNLIKLHAWADLVFENNLTLRLSWPGLFVPRPLVVAIRTWISRNDGRMGPQDYLKQLWLKRAKGVIAVSEAVRKQSYPRATVIGNPYRAKQFQILSQVERGKEFVFLGRLVSDKGADKAITAIHHLNKSNSSKFSLTIIGDGPEKNILERLVIDLKLEDHVHFKGTLRGDELVKCLNLHRFILVPSVWKEPFGNVALEGMACGCIPIVSDGGGLPDAVGTAGLIFERGNLQSMLETIDNLINEPELQKRLIKEATNHLAAHHPEAIAKRYLEIIEEAMAAYKKVLI